MYDQLIYLIKCTGENFRRTCTLFDRINIQRKQINHLEELGAIEYEIIEALLDIVVTGRIRKYDMDKLMNKHKEKLKEIRYESRKFK